AVLTAPGPRRRARGGRGGGLSAVRAILLAGAVRRAARTGGVLATPGLGIDPVRLGETLIDSITLLVDRGPLLVRLGLTPLSSDRSCSASVVLYWASRRARSASSSVSVALRSRSWTD